MKCETVAGARTCHTGSQTAGQRITDFLIRNGLSCLPGNTLGLRRLEEDLHR